MDSFYHKQRKLDENFENFGPQIGVKKASVSKKFAAVVDIESLD